MEEIIKRHNHYVPEMYLNNWAHEKRIYSYQLLVSHNNVPLWNHSAVKNTASIDNLYVRVSKGNEIDDFENEFMKYETAAKEPLLKACTDQRMTPNDWHELIGFVATQIVRTPAFFFRTKDKMKEFLPTILDDIGKKLAILTPEEIKQHSHKKTSADDLIPAAVRLTDIKPDNDHRYVEIKTIAGKSLWLFSIDHLIKKTASILHEHKWSIISASNGIKWPTSDDPVLCLNYYGKNDYDFWGGWGNPGSEIIMPISPRKALYTQVGKKHSPRLNYTYEESLLLKKLITEHAFMYVYASDQDVEIPLFRPRIVDIEEYRRIMKELSEWHGKYKEEEVPLLEKRLITDNPNPNYDSRRKL